MEPLTQKFIRKLHEILMTGTVDAYRDQVRPGEYRTITSRPRDRQLLPAGQIRSSLGELITSYEHQTEIERNHILDTHFQQNNPPDLKRQTDFGLSLFLLP